MAKEDHQPIVRFYRVLPEVFQVFTVNTYVFAQVIGIGTLGLVEGAKKIIIIMVGGSNLEDIGSLVKPFTGNHNIIGYYSALDEIKVVGCNTGLVFIPVSLKGNNPVKRRLGERKPESCKISIPGTCIAENLLNRNRVIQLSEIYK